MYRPNQRRSCCPHYTIRLDSHEFKPSRTQRQTINRFNKFVLGEEYTKEAARLHPKTKEEAKLRDNEFALVDRVHEAEYDRVKLPPEPAHQLVVTLETDEFTEEKYQVYDNYQRMVHHDAPEDRTRRQFTRFLCSSPLRRQVMVGQDGRSRRLGSYHQCYRLDGKLVAIGVLDLLPDCVSSVYFLYDESIHKHTPGKLGALYEIALALEDGYRWWYPGFYIHSCPKMRYKIDYMPQYILDPEALVWDKLTKDVLKLLDEKPFVSLYQERSNARENGKEKAGDDQSTSDSLEGEQLSDRDGDEEDQSLFHSTMPGIASLEDMEDVDLNHIVLKGRRTGPLYETSDIVGWDTSGIDDFPGIKARVAELVAALGTDCTDVLCLDLTR
jgi:arginyl-tRNA---protein transferase